MSKANSLACVEEDGDEIFTPIPNSCQKFGCKEHHPKLENRGGFMVCPRCKVSYGRAKAGGRKPTASKTPKPSTSASAICCSDRLEQLKAELNERRLTEISAMLDDAGVPAWVENLCHKGVPSNSTVMRLKWYLARRKNVAAAEMDQKLQRDMKEAEKNAREYMSRYNIVLGDKPATP